MPRLKRELTFIDALGIDIGAIIGAGIFVISGIAVGAAGPSSIISIVIGAIIAIFTGLCYAELAHLYAKEGGTYEYARLVLGNYAGFLAGGIGIISFIINTSAVSLSFASYLLSILKLNIGSEAVGAVLIIFLASVNMLGAKSSARTSTVLTVIKILVLALFVLVGVFFIKPSNYVPFAPQGINGILVGSAFIFFAYTGFARVTTMSEEVKNPKKIIPKTIIYSIIISCVIYVLVMFVFVGIAPSSVSANSLSPLESAIMYATHNQYISYTIALGALIATLNVSLSMVLGMSRIVFAMARDRELPKRLSRLNRFGAPYLAIALPSLLIIAAIFTINFKETIALSNTTVLISYTLTNLAALKLYLNNKHNTKGLLFKSRYFLAVPVLGTATTLLTLSFLTTFSILATAILLVLITIYYAVMRYLIKKNR